MKMSEPKRKQKFDRKTNAPLSMLTNLTRCEKRRTWLLRQLKRTRESYKGRQLPATLVEIHELELELDDLDALIAEYHKPKKVPK